MCIFLHCELAEKLQAKLVFRSFKCQGDKNWTLNFPQILINSGKQYDFNKTLHNENKLCWLLSQSITPSLVSMRNFYLQYDAIWARNKQNHSLTNNQKCYYNLLESNLMSLHVSKVFFSLLTCGGTQTQEEKKSSYFSHRIINNFPQI